MSVDAYQALVARYNDAENIRVIVVDADEYVDDAEGYASDASKAAGSLSNYNSNQFMLMGV